MFLQQDPEGQELLFYAYKMYVSAEQLLINNLH